MSVHWAAAGRTCHLPFFVSGACCHASGHFNVQQSVSVLAAVHWLEGIRVHRTSVSLCCRVLDSIKDNLRKEQSTVMEFNFLTMNKILSPIQVRHAQAESMSCS